MIHLRLSKRSRYVVPVLCYLLALPGGGLMVRGGQQAQVPTIRVEADLVEVPVTVTDRKGNPIIRLTSEDFRIYEDGVEQSVRHFTKEPGPVSWGLVLDKSGSMASMMNEVYASAAHMVESAPAGSEAFVLTFDDHTELVQEFTTDRARLRESVARLFAGGATALWDAVSNGLEEMKKARYARKALVVVTDGEDNESRTSSKDLIERAKESDVLIYSVAMLEGAVRPSWLFGDGASGVLNDLAGASGAYAHRPRSVEQCKEVMQRIASEVSHQYILGYCPSSNAGPPRFRKLAIKVRGIPEGRAVVRARKGYFGPRT